MHYKNGREAKESDPVVHIDGDYVRAGTLNTLMGGSDSCNAYIAVPRVGGIDNHIVTIGECYHAEDAFKAADAALEASKAAPEAGEPTAE